MNEQHVQNILDLWARMKGKTVSKAIPFWRHKEREVLGVTPLYTIFYKETKGDDPEMVTIDYPFCHEIIKGLDEPNRFFEELGQVVSGYEKGDPDFDWNISGLDLTTNVYVLQEQFTATVKQMLEALWKMGHGSRTTSAE